MVSQLLILNDDLSQFLVFQKGVIAWNKGTAVSKEERRRRNTESSRKWRENNPEIRKQSLQKYKQNHPDKVKANQNKQNSKRTIADYRKEGAKRIFFLGKSKKLITKRRIGICSNCKRSIQAGEIKQTQLHHTHYDLAIPEANTIELCVRCHRQEHARLKRS